MTGLAVAAVLALALLAGWAVLRSVPHSDSWPRRLADCSAAAGLAAGALALLAMLGSGALGSGALRSIGTPWWAVGLGTASLVLFGSAAWLGVDVLRQVLDHRLAGANSTGANSTGEASTGKASTGKASTGGASTSLYAVNSEPDQHEQLEPVEAPSERSRNAS
jgi:hypothetical protein